MSYRRFKMPEIVICPATLATFATVHTDTPASVANVASVAGPVRESAFCAPVPTTVVGTPAGRHPWRHGGDNHTEHIRRIVESGRDWSAEDWQVLFDERAAIAEFDGGLPPEEAESRAFACCVVEWLNRHPCPSAPGRCAHCCGWESHGAVVLPFGTEPGTHVWLHADCWSTWYHARQAEAVAAMAAMGIHEPGILVQKDARRGRKTDQTSRESD